MGVGGRVQLCSERKRGEVVWPPGSQSFLQSKDLGTEWEERTNPHLAPSVLSLTYHHASVKNCFILKEPWPHTYWKWDTLRDRQLHLARNYFSWMNSTLPGFPWLLPTDVDACLNLNSRVGSKDLPACRGNTFPSAKPGAKAKPVLPVFGRWWSPNRKCMMNVVPH